MYLKRLALCWFILALGATPSTAMKNNFFGLISRNIHCNKKRIFIKLDSRYITEMDNK